jgi:hypothetical protein
MVDRLRVTELDFDTIKENLKDFLSQQSEFTDYNFEGSGLSVLLDILAYNTHYQAYYLNMVANEAFMDTALLRNSVVSHAKSLGYVPYSRKASRAFINLTGNTTTNTAGSLTIPKGYTFFSEDVDGISYNFVTLEDTTVTKANTDYTFMNLPIYEGTLVNYLYVHNEAQNPKQVFLLPDTSIDTSTIKVSVQPSASNTQVSVYLLATDSSNTTSQSEVFFLQESLSEEYQIYFGDNKIGKKLEDGSVITIEYLTTNGELANRANNFVITESLVDSLNDTEIEFIVDPVSPASGGAEKESIDEIKFSAPIQFTTQNRLVTYADYAAYIKKNYPTINSISVWGGEDESPPVFGTVFVSMQPKTGYYISDVEKQKIIDDIIKPKAIVAINTIIRDPEYLYLLINSNVLYNPKKTTLTGDELKNSVLSAILDYRDNNLDQFESTFVLSKAQDVVDAVDTNTIIGSEVVVRVQKRFKPSLGSSTPYTINFNVPLHRGTVSNRMTSTQFIVFDSNGVQREVFFEELPQSYTGIASIRVLNPGQNYTSTPTVTITGDGTGATATATIVNGTLQNVTITNRGINYSRATVSITDGGGFGATAEAVIDARTGSLQTVYYDDFSQKQIVNSNAGIVNYELGVVTISDIRILSVSAPDGFIRLSFESEKGIISTAKNTIITIDEEDPLAIVTTLEVV